MKIYCFGIIILAFFFSCRKESEDRRSASRIDISKLTGKAWIYGDRLAQYPISILKFYNPDSAIHSRLNWYNPPDVRYVDDIYKWGFTPPDTVKLMSSGTVVFIFPIITLNDSLLFMHRGPGDTLKYYAK